MTWLPVPDSSSQALKTSIGIELSSAVISSKLTCHVAAWPRTMWISSLDSGQHHPHLALEQTGVELGRGRALFCLSQNAARRGCSPLEPTAPVTLCTWPGRLTSHLHGFVDC